MQRLSVITASRYRVSVCKRFITRKCAAAALMPELPFTTLCIPASNNERAALLNKSDFG